jgi:hypothetical protein
MGLGTPFNAANTRLGVGNGTTAFAVGQTDLQGASKLRKALDTGYPSVNGNTIALRTTFAQGEANFAWNEWGIFNAATGGVMLNRVVESNGTKQNNQTWILDVSITFSIGT